MGTQVTSSEMHLNLHYVRLSPLQDWTVLSSDDQFAEFEVPFRVLYEEFRASYGKVQKVERDSISELSIQNATQLYLGQGPIRFAHLDTSHNPLGYRSFGDCSNFNLQMETTSIVHMESESGARRETAELQFQPKITGTLRLYSVHQEVFKEFLFGTASDVLAGSATAEEIEFYAGYSMPLSHSIVSTFTSLTGSGGTPTLTAYTDGAVSGTWDYKHENGMIHYASSPAATLTDGDTLEANYSYKATTEIDPYCTSGSLVAIHFEGKNIAAGAQI